MVNQQMKSSQEEASYYVIYDFLRLCGGLELIQIRSITYAITCRIGFNKVAFLSHFPFYMASSTSSEISFISITFSFSIVSRLSSKLSMQ